MAQARNQCLFNQTHPPCVLLFCPPCPFFSTSRASPCGTAPGCLWAAGFSAQDGFSLRTFTRAPQTQHVWKPPLHAACAPPGAGRPGGTPRAHGEHAARRGDGGETLPRQVHHPGFAARAFQLHGHTDTPLLQPSQPVRCRGTSTVRRKSVLGSLGGVGLPGPKFDYYYKIMRSPLYSGSRSFRPQ